MDLNRLIQMIVNQLLRRLINRGIDAGINKVAGKPAAAKTDMTPEERRQARAAKDVARRAKQAMKLTRRL
jgi:hypothetical protein